MSKERHYRKVTRERLIEQLELIGYIVTNQSSDGAYKLLRYPDKKTTDYWLFNDRLEHRLDDNRGGAYFHYKDCKLICDDETICIMAKTDGKSVFAQFHNFKSHQREY